MVLLVLFRFGIELGDGLLGVTTENLIESFTLDTIRLPLIHVW